MAAPELGLVFDGPVPEPRQRNFGPIRFRSTTDDRPPDVFQDFGDGTAGHQFREGRMDQRHNDPEQGEYIAEAVSYRVAPGLLRIEG